MTGSREVSEEVEKGGELQERCTEYPSKTLHGRERKKESKRERSWFQHLPSVPKTSHTEEEAAG